MQIIRLAAAGNFWDVETHAITRYYSMRLTLCYRRRMIFPAKTIGALRSHSASTVANRQQWKLTLLTPVLNQTPNAHQGLRAHPVKYAQLLRDIQTMRGEVYREYEPIAAQLLGDGRHYDPLDEKSWHIVLHTPTGYILGSSRYRVIEDRFEDLAVSHSALASSPEYGPLLKTAVQHHIGQAISSGVRYGEAGMWALRPEARCSTAAVTIALATFAVAKALGGGLGITTATTRHGSSAILQRLGGSTFPDLPSYYEPKYGCVIEILHFDSADLDARYQLRMERVEKELARCDIICATSYEENCPARDLSSRTTADLLALGRHVAAPNSSVTLHSRTLS